MKKTCEICGKEFETVKPNAKFCSPKCQKAGRKVYRLKWQQENNYNAKEREKRAKSREKTRKEENQRAIEAGKKRAEEMERKSQEVEKELSEEIRRGLEESDPLAALVFYTPMQIEYWQAYQDYALRCAADQEQQRTETINGVSVSDPLFPDLIAEQCQAGQLIIHRTE